MQTCLIILGDNHQFPNRFLHSRGSSLSSSALAFLLLRTAEFQHWAVLRADLNQLEFPETFVLLHHETVMSEEETHSWGMCSGPLMLHTVEFPALLL